MSRNKRITLIISIISILLILLIGSAFAFFKWTADKEALVNVTVSSGTGKCELKDDNEIEMFPTYSKYHGRKIKLNAKQEMSEKAYITWNMVINEINGLQDKTFMYELVNNTTGLSYGSGTFENITSGTTITFSNNEEVLGYNREYDFTLYLWIDGTVGNNSINMSNQVFDFDINCNITGTDEGIVEEQYTLMTVTGSQSATTKFLRSDLTREQIESITFVNDMEIPEDAIDVSQNEDDSVMMWYTNDNGDNLFDVYIGTNGGVISLSSGYHLFYYLTNIKTLDLSNINTSNVTDMSYMFMGCENLTTLDVSNFNTSNVKNMQNMFVSCKKLETLDLSSFDTSSVTTMFRMFYNCPSLKLIELSNFNTINVYNMYGMFEFCSALTSLNLTNFDTPNIKEMDRMFSYCSSLTMLDVSSFDTSNIKSLFETFSSCSSLTMLDVSNFDTSNITNMQSAFYGCTSLTTLDVSNWDTSNVTSMKNMFNGCQNLIILDVSHFDTSSVLSMYGTFGGCKNLTNLDVSNWNTSNVKDMFRLFYNCNNIIYLDLSKWNTLKVTNMSEMFLYCLNLTTLDFRSADFSSVTNYGNMFTGVPSNATIYVKDDTQKTWITSKFTTLTGITIPSISA